LVCRQFLPHDDVIINGNIGIGFQEFPCGKCSEMYAMGVYGRDGKHAKDHPLWVFQGLLFVRLLLLSVFFFVPHVLDARGAVQLAVVLDEQHLV
jgi:hypothetical protein